MNNYTKSALSFFACCLFLSSCSLFQPTPIESTQISEPAEEFVYHKVKYPRETYQIISQWYTKSAKNTNLLIAANPRVKPTKIRLGDLVKIPKDLLKRPKSMPRDFVDSFYVKIEKSDASSVAVAEEDLREESRPKLAKTESKSNSSISHESQETISDQSDTVVLDDKLGENEAGRKAEAVAKEQSLPEVPSNKEQSEESSQPEQDENAKIREKLMKELLE